MTIEQKLIGQTAKPKFKFWLLLPPIIFTAYLFYIKSKPPIYLVSVVWFLLVFIDQRYRQFFLYSDKLVIKRSHVLFKYSKIELEVLLSDVKDIRFEAAFSGSFLDNMKYMGYVLFKIAFPFYYGMNAQNIVTISYQDNSTPTRQVQFQFHHRIKNLDSLVAKTKQTKVLGLKIKKR